MNNMDLSKITSGLSVNKSEKTKKQEEIRLNQKASGSKSFGGYNSISQGLAEKTGKKVERKQISFQDLQSSRKWIDTLNNSDNLMEIKETIEALYQLLHETEAALIMSPKNMALADQVKTIKQYLAELKPAKNKLKAAKIAYKK